MGFARLAGAAIALAVLTAPALAVCPICNSSVRLDAGLAACFVKRLDAEVKRLEDSGSAFVIVNLTDCPDTAGRGGLPTATSSRPLDSSFVADAGALKCLGEAIVKHQGPMDPSVLFDLAEICS